MKRLLLATILLLSGAIPANAASFVTQAVFFITSSAKTSTPNLRVVPMGPKQAFRAAESAEAVPFFLKQAGATENRYLTKNQTVDLSTALCLYVEVDQATKMFLNSETAYILLPSGARETHCFR